MSRQSREILPIPKSGTSLYNRTDGNYKLTKQVKMNMKKLIIYGSQYGTTKQYAEKFSEMTGIPCISDKDVKDLTGYDLIIHFGGLYAGNIKGLKATVRALKDDAKLIIVTVGLADPSNPASVKNIRRSIYKAVPERLMKNASIFHLRGGIDYQKLNLKHRAMMAFLYNRMKRLPDEQKTADMKTILETYHSAASFVDYHALEPIANAIQ